MAETSKLLHYSSTVLASQDSDQNFTAHTHPHNKRMEGGMYSGECAVFSKRNRLNDPAVPSGVIETKRRKAHNRASHTLDSHRGAWHGSLRGPAQHKESNTCIPLCINLRTL